MRGYSPCMTTKQIVSFSSLGMSCQTTHQLTTFVDTLDAGNSNIRLQKGPFDWLICPPNSLCHWLGDGLPVFEPAEIIEHRGHAYWPKYRFWFWHGFYRKTGSGKFLDIAATSQREIEKLKYQRQQFSEIIPKSTHFFISNTQNNLSNAVFEADEKDDYFFDIDKIDRLQRVLDEYFSSACRLTVLTREDRCELELAQRENVIYLAREPSEWKGSPSEWQPVLDLQQ